jgi:hypothetical protein
MCYGEYLLGYLGYLPFICIYPFTNDKDYILKGIVNNYYYNQGKRDGPRYSIRLYYIWYENNYTVVGAPGHEE